jgi:hypothetical protein
MSAVADFRLIETTKLNDLRDNAEVKIEKKLFSKKVIDTYWDYLESNAKKLKDFDYSGYVFADLLIFLLEKKGIDLLKGKHDDIANAIYEKRQNSMIILTYDHKRSYLDKLNPDNFTLEELIAFNKEFSEDDDPELAKAEVAGIKTLKENLELLSGNSHVVLLTIG